MDQSVTGYEKARAKARARNRIYNDAHREEVRAYQHSYYMANREKRVARQAAYRAAHPEKEREYHARNYAKRNGAEVCEHPGCLVLGPVQLSWQTNPHTCYLCGAPVQKSANLHFDHVIPIAKGGLHCAENLRPACASCNLTKGTRCLPV